MASASSWGRSRRPSRASRGATAVVLVQDDHTGDKRLVAYVKAAPADSLSERSLRQFLKRKMPDYMVPARIAIVEALPLTPGGKVDRQALPPLAAPCLGDREVPQAPRTPLEEQIALVWTAVLGLDRVGVDDNFFDLGGHSLLATKVVSRLRKGLGRKCRSGCCSSPPRSQGLPSASRIWGRLVGAGSRLRSSRCRATSAFPLSLRRSALVSRSTHAGLAYVQRERRRTSRGASRCGRSNGPERSRAVAMRPCGRRSRLLMGGRSRSSLRALPCRS